MYNEDSFKNYIFWLKVRKIFFMVVFSIVGALVGMVISDFFVDILLFEALYRTLIITVSTLLFFAISLLITSTTGKEVQDGYWKIAVLRKLTVISKKLDMLENFENYISNSVSETKENIEEEILENTEENIEEEIIETKESSEEPEKLEKSNENE